MPSIASEFRWSRTVDAATEIVTAAEVKAHARIDHDDDDTWIDNAIKAARYLLENETRRQFITATYEQVYSAFPNNNVFRLVRPPLISVTSIGYTDTDGNAQTVISSDYVVDTKAEPGLVTLAYGEIWPSTYDEANVVTVTFQAGYGAATTDVPEPIRQAALMLIAHWYEFRPAVVVGTVSKDIEWGIKAMIGPYCMPEMI